MDTKHSELLAVARMIQQTWYMECPKGYSSELVEAMRKLDKCIGFVEEPTLLEAAEAISKILRQDLSTDAFEVVNKDGGVTALDRAIQCEKQAIEREKQQGSKESEWFPSRGIDSIYEK